MSELINFYTTSNMAIEINEMRCYECEEKFYELYGHELENCPLCGSEFEYGISEPDTEESDSDTYLLIVDPKTGIPSVVRRKEEEEDGTK